MLPPPGFRLLLPALVAGSTLLLAGCSGPPPPAPEPTGAELERAWRIAVGSEPLDQTIAQLYTQALNAHQTPATLVEDPEEQATTLALGLAEEGDQQPDTQAEDERYEFVIARTMPLAEALDPEGYAELTSAAAAEDTGPAAAPEELTALIDSGMSQAELMEPAEAVLRSGVLITSITETSAEIAPEDETSIEELAAQCPQLRIGATDDIPAAEDLLVEVYDCQPEDWVVQEEGELIESLITAEVDAAMMTTSHPGAVEHQLTVLNDSRLAFPHDQYAPVVSSRIADQVPDVVDEISADLDDEALQLLRRLIHGEQSLTPEEAAQYWLVENDIIAEPEPWG